MAAEIAEQVRLLDGLVLSVGDNAELIGAWTSARNVLGLFMPPGEPEVGESKSLWLLMSCRFDSSVRRGGY